MNEQPIALSDYRSTMQHAALCFLLNHQAEHLSGDTKLTDRAVQHLIQLLDVPVFLAAELVQQALEQLHKSSKAQRIAITARMDAVSVLITDNLTGDVALIPRRILPERFLAVAYSHATPNH